MIEAFDISEWDMPVPDRVQACLEAGAVVAFPHLHFALTEAERAMIRGAGTDGSAKNISLDPASGVCKGDSLAGEAHERLTAMLGRFGERATQLVLGLAPGYLPGLSRGRTSFRPNEIAAKQCSWRQDDKRLHIDAFPTRPLRGRRILRVFANIDFNGTPRRWRVGPEFESYASRFLPNLPREIPGQARLLSLLGVTKAPRSRYDEVMLFLHDAAKRDTAWQREAEAAEVEFAAGSAWAVFTDQVPHAALAGRNALEQTFYIEPAVLARPEAAPLAVLERLCGRALI